MNPRLLADISTELPKAPADGPWPTEALLFTQMPLEEGRRLQQAACDRIAEGEGPGHQLLLMEHPPTYLIGGSADPWPLALAEEECRRQGLKIVRTEQVPSEGPDQEVEYFGPGQLMAYLTLSLEHWQTSAESLMEAVELLLRRILAEFGVSEVSRDDSGRVLTDERMIASITTRVLRECATARLKIHTNTDPQAFEIIRQTNGRPGLVTLTALGMPVERQDEAREAFIRHYEAVFDSQVKIPPRGELRTTKPPWLRARLPTASGTERVHDIIGRQRLHTVCESAHCPNMGECWTHGTATFMINGNVCTRSCSFCAIFTGRPQPIDPDEPRRVAEAARTMGLSYAVVTAVNRDELADGGAGQFARTITELRRRVPDIRVEVLIPDFKGDLEALGVVFAVRPDVLNHNIETVPRLYRRVRPQARYERSLGVLRGAREAGLVAKSGLMLGLGEEAGEVEQVLSDLRAHGCDVLTIGQYLRSSEKHHPVIRYVTPSEFDHWRQAGLALGFTAVESGPLVRSSYHAHDSFHKHTGRSLS